jgi:pyridoxine/pyridoxamine 5'-phosphate oxidase
MKQVIEQALRKICYNSSATVNTESGRNYISDTLLKTFEDKNIVFYTNKYNKKKALK